MGHYVRLLTPASRPFAIASIQEAISSANLKAIILPDIESSEPWDQITIAHGDGVEITVIERNSVTCGSLGEAEIAEFAEEVASYKPASAGQWLRSYLPQIKTIYTFQILPGVSGRDGWSIFHEVRYQMWVQLGGITQADFEGFSNDHGYHILWQFKGNKVGLWWMGLRIEDSWFHFQMDLGNEEQKESFLRGELPRGIVAQRVWD